MSSEKSKQPSERDVLSMDEARPIVETQVQLLQHLNDELLRTIRIHVLLAGAVVAGTSTVVSTFGVELFLPQNFLSFWFLSVALTTFSGLWIAGIFSARISYTKLRIGVSEKANPPNYPEQNLERSNGVLGFEQSPLEKFRSLVSSACSSVVLSWRSLLKILSAPRTVDDIENETDPDEVVHRMLGKDYESVVRYNTWILHTREKYVNETQAYLALTFLFFILGLLGLIAS